MAVTTFLGSKLVSLAKSDIFDKNMLPFEHFKNPV